MTTRRDPRATPKGLLEALRLRRLPARRPTDGDRPPVSTLPGRKAEAIPGQMTLDGGDVPLDPADEARR